jgi:hypothetical protein
MVMKVERTLAILLLAWTTCGADLAIKTADVPVPSQIAEAIRSSLQPKAIQIMQGDKPILQIWLRPEAPLKSKPSAPAAGPSSIPDFSLLGAVSVSTSGLKDYKDNDIPSGLFTLRFITQPQDGDHLGTAEFNTFIALVPAENDKAADAFTKFTPLVKASGKLTPSGHPLVLNLRPVVGKGEPFSIVEPEAEHKAIRIKAQGKTIEGDKADLIFDLVFQGHGHIQ